MIFKAKLKFGSKDNIDVIRCDYTLRRDVDAKGRPSSGVYGGLINLSIESSDDTTIIESMINAFNPVDGTITFKESDQDIKLKELSWEKGYIINFKEGIDSTSTRPMMIEFTISAEKIILGKAEHNNNWQQ